MTVGAQLFREHVDTVSRWAEEALEIAAEAGESFDGIVFHAGSPTFYHADDQAPPFRPVPHFARWTPAAGPDHLLRFRPGERPRLARVVPRDYWFEAPRDPDHPYPETLEVVEVGDAEAAVAALGDVARCAYVGNDRRVALALGLPEAAVEPGALRLALDWMRGTKTSYEVECIREAGRIAARGHAAARACAAARASEREIHAAYLEATGLLDTETPYPNIIAWDEAAAVLHYQSRRRAAPVPGAHFLIDAGGSWLGYASDVTRTYAFDGAHPVFAEALSRMDALQRALVDRVAPKTPYVAVHAAAVEGVAAIISDLGIVRGSASEIVSRGLALPFLPHGVGHHLGLQVHDVGGQQVSVRGDHRPPPAEHPYLRTTRDLAEGHVVTIEPGLYFIPLLLEPFRRGPERNAFDWELVDALAPCGGIRIEDDVLVTADGREDLTRPLVPGHAE